MSAERGDVVVASDPFKDDASGRPFLVINRPEKFSTNRSRTTEYHQ